MNPATRRAWAAFQKGAWQTAVELTSGNTGTGLAIVCGVKGYPFVAVMSRGNSMERARMMRALHAEVVLVEQMPGSQPGQVSSADLALVEQARGAFRMSDFGLHQCQVNKGFFKRPAPIVSRCSLDDG